MATENLKEKIERLRVKAEYFLKEDKRVFIKDIYDNFHFADILLIGEDWIYVQHFSGRRTGEKSRILWVDIINLEEYKEVGESGRE